jgi:hypothetical protein
MATSCLCCGEVFPARNKSQRYCLKTDCQRSRKKHWQKQKLLSDPCYRANQKQAQESWLKKHPGYFRDYRKIHPVYAARNRERQRHRNGLRGCNRGKEALLQRQPMIAKMDARPSIKSGTYRLIPIEAPLIAKMDSVVVELSVVSSC